MLVVVRKVTRTPHAVNMKTASTVKVGTLPIQKIAPFGKTNSVYESNQKHLISRSQKIGRSL